MLHVNGTICAATLALNIASLCNKILAPPVPTLEVQTLSSFLTLVEEILLSHNAAEYATFTARWFPALVSDCLYTPNHFVSL